MIDGVYKIQVDTPLGRKPGLVDLRTDGNTMHAIIDAPIIGKQTTTVAVNGNSFEGEGTLKALMLGKIKYKLTGEVAGDGITICIDSNKGKLNLEGSRV